ncbi:spherulation-specific family 4 protein [Streptomyces barkulensis]|uniref:spherulation-specific family 4 protein n=1 Tax=Streptomyces barkulensis TaxID=1257026 RepID=UPI000C6EF879|nr:spherulation-specific family 4 protein [Streptomyces barkulensis]
MSAGRPGGTGRRGSTPAPAAVRGSRDRGRGRGHLLVPLYVHPAVDPGAWEAAVRAAGRLYAVVVNAADGPGPRPDPALAAVAARLRGAGVPLLGYVDTAYGARPWRAVLRDVRRHRRWYGTDGAFLDRAAAGAEHLPRYRRTVRAARLLGASTVVLNPGVHPDPGYAHLADVLVTFEGCWEEYRRAGAPAWTRGHPPHRFCHLVYAVPDRLAAEAARTAHERGAAVHCAVPGEGANPWRSTPRPVLGCGRITP